jgi:hypothetical protein
VAVTDLPSPQRICGFTKEQTWSFLKKKKKTKRVQLFSQRGRRIIVNLNSVMFFFSLLLTIFILVSRVKLFFQGDLNKKIIIFISWGARNI